MNYIITYPTYHMIWYHILSSYLFFDGIISDPILSHHEFNLYSLRHPISLMFLLFGWISPHDSHCFFGTLETSSMTEQSKSWYDTGRWEEDSDGLSQQLWSGWKWCVQSNIVEIIAIVWQRPIDDWGWPISSTGDEETYSNKVEATP